MLAGSCALVYQANTAGGGGRHLLADGRSAEATLFDRIQSTYKDRAVKLLTTQYRMNEKIMAWASAALYNNRLVADPSVRQAGRG